MKERQGLIPVRVVGHNNLRGLNLYWRYSDTLYVYKGRKWQEEQQRECKSYIAENNDDRSVVDLFTIVQSQV